MGAFLFPLSRIIDKFDTLDEKFLSSRINRIKALTSR